MKFKFAMLAMLIAAFSGGSSSQEKIYRCGNEYSNTVPDGNPGGCKLITGNRIAMKKSRGTFVVPVHINDAISLDFVVDSGAADVSVPVDVFSTLVRAGTIGKADITGSQTYVLADGSTSRLTTFNIRSLRVGGMVLRNVAGSVAPTTGSLLLGQSFLNRFKSWSIDNAKNELVLD
jgi:clan AA aspartic protease (TIGR02281 family)